MLERVECVALHERGVQRGEDVGAADVVQDGRTAADEHERAGLAVVQGDRAEELVEALAAPVVDVVHRAGVGGDVHPRGLAGDLVPDVALHGARSHAGGDACVGGAVLHAAQRRVGGLRGRAEGLVVTTAVPPAGLDAADRHLQLRARADEHGDVERPVLLGAEDLLALVEQDRLIGRVEDEQVVDRGALLELLDRGAGARPWANDTYSAPRRGSEDREDGERPVDVGIAEAQGLGEWSCRAGAAVRLAGM